MNRTIWKAIFFITLTVFIVLTVLLIVFVIMQFTTVPQANFSIIGGMDQPSYLFLLSMILRSPLFNLWLGSLLTVFISLSGWLASKK
jgi:hypothetical protein